ncbi:mechanosensitive ion channel family protein [Reyranella sp.]|jgi:small-conductance mechanosensitive channel|uniref:mechanosensitive ion channel family protein n=1 Tax=Reyranella sp. TaxID=1929291 RepID=UPI002F924A6E
MFGLRAFALTISLLVLGTAASRAETPTPPAGMTQEQFDALVDAIGNSVVEKLKAEGIAAPAPEAAAKPKSGKGAPAPKAEIVRVPPRQGPGEFALFLQRLGRVVLAFPELGRQLAGVAGGLDQESNKGWGMAGFVLVLGLIAAAAVMAEAALRRLLGKLRARLAAGAGPERGVRSLLNLAAVVGLDAIGLLVVWLICNGAGAWFSGATAQDKFAGAVLAGIFDWRLYLLLFRFVLRPNMATARLCDVSSDAARTMYFRISTVMLVIIIGRVVGRILIANGTPADAVAAFQIVGVAIYVPAFLWLVFGAKAAARQWFGGLGAAAPLAGIVGRHWIGVASSFFVLLGATQFYSAVSGREKAGGAMLLTLMLVVGVLIFQTLMLAFVRRLDSQLAGRTPAGDLPKLPDVVARCVRVAVLIGVAVTIAETWAVEVLGLVSPDQWEQITRSSRTAAVTLFLAFVVWELFKYATDPYMARKSKDAAAAIVDGDAAAAPASRISTMMPLLRMAAAILIIFLAVVIALEDFGINVMPLIAGASIFGIAISFGSQTLVRDIVSGIFYLTDDAFRVGEYIDCGRAKGTVEGFTLRSIKLRHQNGQVHTIPFGQLGQITNFSRDWITVKFNLRFARDTDIEKLRKAAKKIGAEMLEVPEIKSEILAPFKMQGVADIIDNALLVRFKFTARPGNPAMIQREAVKRMFKIFPELGIEFAQQGATVILQTPHAAAEGQPATSPAATAQAGAPTSVAAG